MSKAVAHAMQLILEDVWLIYGMPAESGCEKGLRKAVIRVTVTVTGPLTD